MNVDIRWRGLIGSKGCETWPCSVCQTASTRGHGRTKAKKSQHAIDEQVSIDFKVPCNLSWRPYHLFDDPYLSKGKSGLDECPSRSPVCPCQFVYLDSLGQLFDRSAHTACWTRSGEGTNNPKEI